MPYRHLTAAPPAESPEPNDEGKTADEWAAEWRMAMAERAAERRVLVQTVETLNQQVSELVVRTKHTDERLREAERKQNLMADGLEVNNATTAEIRDLLAAFKGGFKVLEWLGLIVKWGGIVAGAGTAIYTALYMATHGGHPPGKG